MARTLILSLEGLLPFVKESLIETEGLEEWDAKYLIEICFSMAATDLDLIQDANRVTKRVAERIGLLEIINCPHPEQVFVLIYKIVSRIYYELSNNSLDKMNLYFKDWLGNDIIIEYKESPIKLLTKMS